VTVRRDDFAASQKLRREQERAAAWAAIRQESEKELEQLRKAKVRPDFVVLLCRRAYVLMLCRKQAGQANKKPRRSGRGRWRSRSRRARGKGEGASGLCRWSAVQA
jgi:hypothetical protein